MNKDQQTADAANDSTVRWVKRTSWAIVAVGLAVVLLTVDDFGISWDEAVQARYAELVVDYFASGGEDTSCNEYLDLKIYGPTVNLAAALLYAGVPEYKVLIRHALTAILALLTAPALFRFGRLLGDPWIGVLGAVSLLVSPRFFGHAFINSKDIPFACLFAWSMCAITSLLANRTYRWREVIVCGLLMGLTVSVRPGGWVLLTLLFVAAMVFSDFVIRRNDTNQRNERSVLKLLSIFALAWIVMVIPWPWAHENVLAHPIRAMQIANSFSAVIPVLFEGEVLASDQLPWYYLGKYIAITTPPAMLAIALFGMLVAVRRQLKAPAGPQSAALFMLQIWFFLPLVLCAVKRPNIYDGMRHFLFLLPALGLWFGLGARRLATWPRQPQRRALAAALIWVIAISPAAALVRLHPYQMTYFNSLVGGLQGAAESYETDYWVTSYKEALEWVNSQTRDGRVKVLVAATEHCRLCAEHYRGGDVEIEFMTEYGLKGSIPEEFDYYIATYRCKMAENFPESPIVKRIGREGATFAVVRSRAS